VDPWARSTDCFGDRADRGAFRASGARNRSKLGTRFRQFGGQAVNPERELFESSPARRSQLEARSPNVVYTGADFVHVPDSVSA